MTDMYQVVSECAHVTVDTPHGRTKMLVLKDAVIPGDAPEIKHLLDSNMVVRFGAEPDDATPPVGTTDSSTDTTGAEVKSAGTPASPPPPPMGGPGSGREAWAAYASTRGVAVTDDMKSRDDIVAALKTAGVPTERAE